MQDDVATTEIPPAAEAAPQLPAIPLSRFAALSLCTFGIYEAWWSYRAWKYLRQLGHTRISPFWRAVFYPLWHYALLTSLQQELPSRALASNSFRILLAVAVFVINTLWRLPDPWWLISFLTFVGFLPALRTVNSARAAQEPAPGRESLHWAGWCAYLLGWPLLAFVALSGIGFLPSTAVVSGESLWTRDIDYLRQRQILGAEEEIVYFYSNGMWSIAEDGQFFSNRYVTSYYQDADSGETYLDYAAYSDIDNIEVEWAESLLDVTVVTITGRDDYQFVLWLSSEGGGDRKFVNAMRANWNRLRVQ